MCGHVAGVGFLAVHDLDDVRHEQGIALVVELERAACALEADAGERVANRGAIFLAGLLDRHHRQRDRVVSLRRIGIGNTTEGLLVLGDERLRGRDVGSGRNAKVGREVNAVDRAAA